MTNLTESMKKDIEVVNQEFDEMINMQTMASINVKVPSELQGDAIEVLHLENTDPIVEELHGINPRSLVDTFGSAMLSDFNLNNIIRMERIVRIIKILIIGWLKDHPEHRKTNEQEKELSAEEKKKIFMAMLKMMAQSE